MRFFAGRGGDDGRRDARARSASTKRHRRGLRSTLPRPGPALYERDARRRGATRGRAARRSSARPATALRALPLTTRDAARSRATRSRSNDACLALGGHLPAGPRRSGSAAPRGARRRSRRLRGAAPRPSEATASALRGPRWRRATAASRRADSRGHRAACRTGPARPLPRPARGFHLRIGARHADELRGAVAPEEPDGVDAPLDPCAPRTLAGRLRTNVERALRGKAEVVRQCVETWVAGGHVLIEDVPGVGKTTLAHALARSVDASFRRIQFTSDLLPGRPDRRLGARDRGRARRPAPSCSSPGRSSPRWCSPTRSTAPVPKTQSALLEAMAEGSVSVDGVDPPPAAALPGRRDAESDRAPRRRTRCPSRSSTASCCGCASATRTPSTRPPCCATIPAATELAAARGRAPRRASCSRCARRPSA